VAQAGKLSLPGRLYFTAGNDQYTGYGGSYDPAVFNHVYVHDPASKTISEKKTWMLYNQRAVDAAQCFSAAEERSCLLMDNVGRGCGEKELTPRALRRGQGERRGQMPACAGKLGGSRRCLLADCGSR
jgi:hypothetical protein